MTRCLIRQAREDDLPTILDITNDAIRHGTALWSITPMTLQARAEWMADRLAHGFPVLVAEQNSDVAGFGSYGVFRPFEGYAQTVEHSLYVRAAARGQGVGRALLRALIDHATDAGKHVMVAGIEAANLASIALHEQSGFSHAGVLPQVGRKFDRWLDLLFMVRQL